MRYRGVSSNFAAQDPNFLLNALQKWHPWAKGGSTCLLKGGRSFTRKLLGKGIFCPQGVWSIYEALIGYVLRNPSIVNMIAHLIDIYSSELFAHCRMVTAASTTECSFSACTIFLSHVIYTQELAFVTRVGVSCCNTESNSSLMMIDTRVHRCLTQYVYYTLKEISSSGCIYRSAWIITMKRRNDTGHQSLVFYDCYRPFDFANLQDRI